MLSRLSGAFSSLHHDLGILDQDGELIAGPEILVGGHFAGDEDGVTSFDLGVGGDEKVVAADRADAVLEVNPVLAHDHGVVFDDFAAHRGLLAIELGFPGINLGADS